MCHSCFVSILASYQYLLVDTCSIFQYFTLFPLHFRGVTGSMIHSSQDLDEQKHQKTRTWLAWGVSSSQGLNQNIKTKMEIPPVTDFESLWICFKVCQATMCRSLRWMRSCFLRFSIARLPWRKSRRSTVVAVECLKTQKNVKLAWRTAIWLWQVIKRGSILTGSQTNGTAMCHCFPHNSSQQTETNTKHKSQMHCRCNNYSFLQHW